MAIHTATTDNYEELVKEGFVIVDFYTDTCVPCKTFSKILDAIEFELPFVNIVKVNATQYPELGETNQIMGTPTTFFYKDGELLERHVGVIATDELKEKIGSYLY